MLHKVINELESALNTVRKHHEREMKLGKALHQVLLENKTLKKLSHTKNDSDVQTEYNKAHEFSMYSTSGLQRALVNLLNKVDHDYYGDEDKVDNVDIARISRMTSELVSRYLLTQV